MATLVGKVGIVAKGAWNNSATYEVLDAVSYNNGLYIAKQAVPANTVPTNATYWQVALSPTGLGVLQDFTVTPTGCTVSTCQKAQLGAFVALRILISATSSTVSLDGVPTAALNPSICFAFNNNKTKAIECRISSLGVLSFPGGSADISNGDSIRVSIVYPTAS